MGTFGELVFFPSQIQTSIYRFKRLYKLQEWSLSLSLSPSSGIPHVHTPHPHTHKTKDKIWESQKLEVVQFPSLSNKRHLFLLSAYIIGAFPECRKAWSWHEDLLIWSLSAQIFKESLVHHGRGKHLDHFLCCSPYFPYHSASSFWPTTLNTTSSSISNLLSHST